MVSVLPNSASATIVKEKRLTNSPIHHEVPKIWGNITICLVFPTIYGNPCVYFVGLANSTERPVDSEERSIVQENENISGNRIVWAQNHETSDIYVYDVSTLKKTRITSNGSYVDWPAISGDIVAYLERINGRWQIFYYDLSTSIETQVTFDDVDHDPPNVGGGYIVFVEANGGLTNVFLYNLADRVTTQLTNDGHSGTPIINEGRLLYGDYDENGNDALYLRDLSNGKTIRVAQGRLRHMGYCLSGDLIVYMGNDGSTSDIYAYNISTATEIRISTSGTAVNPAVYENKIVWQDYRDGQEEIYMAELISVKPSPSPPSPNLELAVAVILSGPAVLVVLLWIAKKRGVSKAESVIEN